MSDDADFTPSLIAKHLLWHRGNLSWKHHDGQKVIDAAYRSIDKFLFVGNCSRRFGKTFWVATECAEVALKKKKARVKVATAFLTDLEEFLIPIFDAVFEDCPEEIKPKWHEAKKKYRFKNGSEIQLIGLDRKPNAGRGNYCDLYVFDEAAFIKNVSYIYSSVVIPMTMYRKGARVIMISTPPKSPDHDFKDFVTKARQEKAYVELDIDKNPMVTAEMRAIYKAECLTKTDWLREYKCQFVTDQTLAIIPEMFGYDFSRKDRTPEHYEHFHKYNGMDLGVADFNVNLFGYYDFTRAKFVVERELVMNGPEMTTPKLHAAISKVETELWGAKEPYKRWSDNNNPLLLLDLGAIHNMFFNSTSKDDLHAMVNKVRVWIQDKRIEIDESCVFLIDSLKYGLWNERRTEFARSKHLGHYDAVAALMYLIRNIDETTNPIPVKIGFDQVNLDPPKNDLTKMVPNFRRKR
ncbi:terminase large subunit domain-containing protein [Bdellovibrio sp. HCB288]|uniref:terminase large subunit domain-containing protein n=1 Tax=Bdellovibrio sp. HCB288 TaxID=3394355 RepID=UPI0039B66972